RSPGFANTTYGQILASAAQIFHPPIRGEPNPLPSARLLLTKRARAVILGFSHARNRNNAWPRRSPQLFQGGWVRSMQTRLAQKLMKKHITRRNFVAVAAISALASRSLKSLAQAPDVLTKRTVTPVVISSANGNVSKDAEGLTCVAKA